MRKFLLIIITKKSNNLSTLHSQMHMHYTSPPSLTCCIRTYSHPIYVKTRYNWRKKMSCLIQIHFQFWAWNGSLIKFMVLLILSDSLNTFVTIARATFALIPLAKVEAVLAAILFLFSIEWSWKSHGKQSRILIKQIHSDKKKKGRTPVSTKANNQKWDPVVSVCVL